MSIYQKLYQFQSKVRTVSKDQKGYNYRYASFDNIVNTIHNAMVESQLGFYHMFEIHEGTHYCVCVLFSGEKEDEGTIKVSLPLENPENGKTKMSEIQQLGSSVTYARRYTLTAALGLVTEEDTDGVVQQKPKQKKEAPKQKLNLNSPDVFGKIQERVGNVGVDQTIKEAKRKYLISSEEIDQIKSMGEQIEATTLPKEEEINADEIEF